MGILDRERPYEGQPQTFQGERGAFLLNPPRREVDSPYVGTLTMRDIYDAVLIGMCDAYGVRWDQVTSYEELYQKLDLNGANFDPVAAAQNACVHVEKSLGIYPNLPDPSYRTPGDRVGDEL
jgi:hypothetical protein